MPAIFSSLFSTPQQPSSVNPGQVTQQAQQTNIQNAIAGADLDKINQVTPYGSMTWSRDTYGSDVNGNWIPKYTATTTLSPEQKALYDKQIQVTQGAYDLAGNYVNRIGEATKEPFSLSGAPAAGAVPTYKAPPAFDENYRQQTLDTINQRAQPQMARDRMALESRLANQGISLGTEAYMGGMDDYNRGVNDFRLGADIQAGQDAAMRYQLQLQGANQDFNAGASTFGMANQGRQNYITEQQMQRMQPIQEVAALMGTGGGQQYPTFAPQQQYNVAPVDVGGIYGMAAANDQATYRTQQEGANAAFGGLMQLGGSLGGGYLYGLGRGGGGGSGWTY